MTGPIFTIDIRPSSELMLAFDAIVAVGNRLAAAIEERNKLNAIVERAIAAPPEPAPSTSAAPVKPKQNFTPEALERLRANAAKARAAKTVAPTATPQQQQIAGPVAGDEAPPAPVPSFAITTTEPIKPSLAPTESRTDIMRRIAAVQPPKAVAPPRPVPREPMPEVMRMDAFQVIRWASQRGLTVHLPISDDDMGKVNAKALDIGHPPIVYAPSPRPGARS